MSTDDNTFRRVDWSGDQYQPSDDDDADGLPVQAPRGPGLSAADLELLTLAASAIGAVRVETVEGENWLNLHFADGSTMWSWNPLVHSDDAFNLTISLQLDIFHGQGEVAISSGGVVLVEFVDYGPDPLATARLAVTRAAAEIWKAK
jgi:hypothetical protein